ncbi:MAG TPA: gamma-glutamyl-gamma-aminobutyrate hydrolase family protein [Dehalococcoidia bacterium]|nr:gamma-glutamyl-gamma-aminobutyrate hydrolase family protein [Dehalococcoidia bacterium]
MPGGSQAPRVAVARWEDIPGERLENYWRRLSDASLQPIDQSKPGQTLEGCAGLLLTGGIDVDPGLYGESPWPEVESTNRARDDFELTLLHEALERDLPVLAICRGHQLLNVAMGGTLLQHIASRAHEDLDDERHTSATHDVAIVRGTKLHAVYGRDRLFVNSRHHQAVVPDGVAKALRVAATTDDGLVEALESDAHRWVVSVQWHPERPDLYIEGFDAESRLLFEAFSSAVVTRNTPT